MLVLVHTIMNLSILSFHLFLILQICETLAAMILRLPVNNQGTTGTTHQLSIVTHFN